MNGKKTHAHRKHIMGRKHNRKHMKGLCNLALVCLDRHLAYSWGPLLPLNLQIILVFGMSLNFYRNVDLIVDTHSNLLTNLLLGLNGILMIFSLFL